MGTSGPPAALATSGLSLGVEAFVAAAAASRAGIADARAAFELTFAAPTDAHAFLVFAGLEPLVDALERLRFKPDDAAWLESVGAVDEATRARLETFRFACDLDAAAEGSVIFTGTPALTVEGPYWQAQLVAGLVTGALAESTLAASRLARFAIAADGAVIVEDGAATARRLGGTPLLARAAYVGGAEASTSAYAARRHRVPACSVQTATSIASHPRLHETYAAWLDAAPRGAMVRLDAADLRGSLDALVVALRESPSRRHADDPLRVVVPARVACDLARDIALAFDDAGLREPAIFAAEVKDEASMLELRRSPAPIAGFLVSASIPDDAASLASYALVAIEDGGAWSSRGASPGRKVVVRYATADGKLVADVVHLANERHLRAKASSTSEARFVDRHTSELVPLRGASHAAPLLAQSMRAGRRTAAGEPVDRVRARARASIAALPAELRRLTLAGRYAVGMTPAARALAGDR